MVSFKITRFYQYFYCYTHEFYSRTHEVQLHDSDYMHMTAGHMALSCCVHNRCRFIQAYTRMAAWHMEPMLLCAEMFTLAKS